MRIKGVYLTLNDLSYGVEDRSKYQLASNYLSLFISSFISARRLDIGGFNRVIFEEGAAEDLEVAGDRAFVVRIRQEFRGFEELAASEAAHDYFSRKYIEGFRRFDEKFGLCLAQELQACMERQFVTSYEYELRFAVKGAKGCQCKVFGIYSFDAFRLVLRDSERHGDVDSQSVEILRCIPDPFVVGYDVYEVVLEGALLRVLDRLGNQTAVHKLMKNGAGFTSE